MKDEGKDAIEEMEDQVETEVQVHDRGGANPFTALAHFARVRIAKPSSESCASSRTHSYQLLFLLSRILARLYIILQPKHKYAMTLGLS